MKRILSYGAVLRPELEAFIKAKKSGGHTSTPWQDDLLDRLLPFATTGKLLRGSVACFAYEAFAGEAATGPVITAAIALELTHSALLIHDDIMDKDAVRRGRPSLHQQYQTLADHENLADAAHFGISMAICGGDAAFFLAFELLADNQASPRIHATVTQLFVNQLVSTCAGQMQDLYLEAKLGMASKQAIYNLMRTKTASYTLALPLAIGAAYAGQTTSVLAKVQAIGIDAGTIFQIRDDELGVMGEAKQIGKPVGADIREGKKTLPYYYLLKSCSTKDRSRLLSVFGNEAATAEDIAYVQALVRRYKIPQLLSREVKRLEARTLKNIDKLGLGRQSTAGLKELVAFCSERQA